MATEFSKGQSKRHLIRWNETLDKKLLLCVQHACNQDGIKIPWTKVGELMNDETTGGAITEGAIVQHLAKTRNRMIEEALPVPPPLKRGSKNRISTTSITNDRASRTVNNTANTLTPRIRKLTRKSRARNARGRKSDEEDDSDSDEDVAEESDGDCWKPRSRLTIPAANRSTKTFKQRVTLGESSGEGQAVASFKDSDKHATGDTKAVANEADAHDDDENGEECNSEGSDDKTASVDEEGFVGDSASFLPTESVDTSPSPSEPFKSLIISLQWGKAYPDKVAGFTLAQAFLIKAGVIQPRFPEIYVDNVDEDDTDTFIAPFGFPVTPFKIEEDGISEIPRLGRFLDLTGPATNVDPQSFNPSEAFGRQGLPSLPNSGTVNAAGSNTAPPKCPPNPVKSHAWLPHLDIANYPGIHPTHPPSLGVGPNPINPPAHSPHLNGGRYPFNPPTYPPPFDGRTYSINAPTHPPTWNIGPQNIHGPVYPPPWGINPHPSNVPAYQPLLDIVPQQSQGRPNARSSLKKRQFDHGPTFETQNRNVKSKHVHFNAGPYGEVIYGPPGVIYPPVPPELILPSNLVPDVHGSQAENTRDYSGLSLDKAFQAIDASTYSNTGGSLLHQGTSSSGLDPHSTAYTLPYGNFGAELPQQSPAPRSDPASLSHICDMPRVESLSTDTPRSESVSIGHTDSMLEDESFATDAPQETQAHIESAPHTFQAHTEHAPHETQVDTGISPHNVQTRFENPSHDLQRYSEPVPQLETNEIEPSTGIHVSDLEAAGSKTDSPKDGGDLDEFFDFSQFI